MSHCWTSPVHPGELQKGCCKFLRNGSLLAWSSEFRELLSGRRTAPPRCWRARTPRFGVPTPWRFAGAIPYDQGHAEIVWVGVPVVSVGNLTLGAPARRPVEWLATWFADQGVRVGLVSAVMAPSRQTNDESLELAASSRMYPSARSRSSSRCAASSYENWLPLVLLDDAFQHRTSRAIWISAGRCVGATGSACLPARHAARAALGLEPR